MSLHSTKHGSSSIAQAPVARVPPFHTRKPALLTSQLASILQEPHSRKPIRLQCAKSTAIAVPKSGQKPSVERDALLFKEQEGAGQSRSEGNMIDGGVDPEEDGAWLVCLVHTQSVLFILTIKKIKLSANYYN